MLCFVVVEDDGWVLIKKGVILLMNYSQRSALTSTTLKVINIKGLGIKNCTPVQGFKNLDPLIALATLKSEYAADVQPCV